jgi:mannose-6-phosphate isomerase-like protein (cupin superfamily)
MQHHDTYPPPAISGKIGLGRGRTAEPVTGAEVSAPFVLAPGQRHPDLPPIPRGPFVRLASAQTDGLIALMEVQLPPLTAGPNLHVHANEDEMFYVLGGVMTVQIGEELHEIAAGGLAWGARGTAHAYANRANEPLRLLIQLIPGGTEELFAEMGAYLQNVVGAPDEEVTAAIMARYGGTRIAPPISIL